MASALAARLALPVTSLLQYMELSVRSVTQSILGARGHSPYWVPEGQDTG